MFALVVALALGSAWGPIGAFSAIATCATILVILTYIAVCLGTFVYYRRERPEDFRRLAHAFVPLLAGTFLVAPLTYQFVPLPAYPIRWGNWLALVWLAAGLIVLAVAEARRPALLATARRVMLEESPEAE